MSEEGKEAKKSFWRASKQKIQNIERPEKKRNKLQKDTSRRVAIFVWSLLLFTAIFTTLGIFLSLNTRSAFNDLSREVKQPEKETALRSVNTIAGQNFLKDFIPAYINVTNNADALKKRQETLQTYLAKQTDNTMEESPFDVAGIKGNRIFKSSSLYNTVEQDKTTIFQYRVTFVNQTVTERTVGKKVKKGKGKKKKTVIKKHKVQDKKEKEQTGLLNIPVIANGTGYAVKGTPYFSSSYALKGTIQVKTEELPEYTGTQSKAIEAFLQDFFEKYTTAKKEDMAYMMKSPETVQGFFSFAKINNLTLYQGKEGVIAKGIAVFEEKETKIPTDESFTINLQKKGGQYFVSDFKHE